MIGSLIDTDKFSEKLRAKAIDQSNKRILITNFFGSDQELDLSEPPNCNGYGRLRHFRLETTSGWPLNPLPIYPANKALQSSKNTELAAQVFQNSACNWRCWYCFVDFSLLSADPKRAGFFTARELIDLYLSEQNRPKVIDLTGGQPDLTPEWIPWMMMELRAKELEKETYLWSDDNLSNDYFWHYLNDKEIELVSSYENYGKVCCFKGFDPVSFSYNTKAEPELFQRQFDLFKRLLTLRIDLYCYTTFTTPLDIGIEDQMKGFVDKLQELHEYLPLRTVPLEIKIFSPTKNRIENETPNVLTNQWKAIELWKKELTTRFSSQDLALNICDIPLK